MYQSTNSRRLENPFQESTSTFLSVIPTLASNLSAMSASAARIVSREGVYIVRILVMDTFHSEPSIITRIPTLNPNVLLHSPKCLQSYLHIPRWNLLSSSLLTMKKKWRKISLRLEEEKLFITTVLKMSILVVLERRKSLVPSLGLLLFLSLFPLEDSV